MVIDQSNSASEGLTDYNSFIIEGEELKPHYLLGLQKILCNNKELLEVNYNNKNIKKKKNEPYFQ